MDQVKRRLMSVLPRVVMTWRRLMTANFGASVDGHSDVIFRGSSLPSSDWMSECSTMTNGMLTDRARGRVRGHTLDSVIGIADRMCEPVVGVLAFVVD